MMLPSPSLIHGKARPDPVEATVVSFGFPDALDVHAT